MFNSPNYLVTHDSAYTRSLTHNTIIFRPDWGSTRHTILLSGDVEMNPGPVRVGEGNPATTVKIITYNTRGLKDKLKLKRVLNKCYKLLKENQDSFILLQETHLDESESKEIELLWRHNFCVSPSIGRQGGTLTLFDSSWENKADFNDINGRFCSALVTKYGQLLSINNIYAPNDHNISFFTEVYDKLFETVNQHPESKIILAGDFNLVMGQGDSLNRNSNNAERRSRKFIIEQNLLLNLYDSYKINNPTGGYTWSRGKCSSRLDMIFLHKDLLELGIK